MTIHLAALLLLISSTPTPSIEATLATTSVLQQPAASPQQIEIARVPAIEEAAPPFGFPDTPGLTLDGLEVDIEKISRQRDTLFPFVTAALPFLDEVRERVEPRADRLVNPLGRERKASKYPALALAPDELQRLVDSAWSRRTRWQSFSQIATLIGRHDPDSGDAAALVREHLDQNLLQPYFDSTRRDPRFWVMLALAADHAPFIDFVSAFAREHPSSRTTTELLFMLDEFAQASRDAMLMLLSTDPRAQLGDTFAADSEAFALAEWVYRRYGEWAQREGLSRTDAVRARFDDVRIGILRTIVASTPDGYGASDARYLLGLIHWDRNDVQGALRWWGDLPPDMRDGYREAADAITRELSRAGGGSAAAVSSVLGSEYRRWLTYSAARLGHFGYAFDTF